MEKEEAGKRLKWFPDGFNFVVVIAF